MCCLLQQGAYDEQLVCCTTILSETSLASTDRQKYRVRRLQDSQERLAIEAGTVAGDPTILEALSWNTTTYIISVLEGLMLMNRVRHKPCMLSRRAWSPLNIQDSRRLAAYIKEPLKYSNLKAANIQDGLAGPEHIMLDCITRLLQMYESHEQGPPLQHGSVAALQDQRMVDGRMLRAMEAVPQA